MLDFCRKIVTLILSCTLALTIIPGFGNTASAAEYSGYIMGYFKDGADQYGINLCYSTDGLHWTNLNNGNPVYVPTLGQKGLRDPYLFRKQDGTFAVVATDMRGQSWGDHSQYIHYFESKDLRTFTNERLLKVHNTDMHAWAPEVFYDEKNSRYGIYWSGNTDYNRTYVNYTADFINVTSNQVLFDPGYDVIDSHIISNGGTNYLFFKDERSSGKRIKAAKSTSFNPGSFSVFTPNFITSANTEGPITFKDNNSNTWYMYADLFAKNGIFECWKTTDLNANSWQSVTNISVPSGVRHGSIVPVTQAELDVARGMNIYGDLNGDKKVNSTDYLTMRQYILGIINTMPDSNWELNGDLNLDGKINSTDYLLLKKYLLGLVESLPVSNNSLDTAKKYKIVNVNSGKAINVVGSAKEDGAKIEQCTFSGLNSQVWSFIDAGQGYYKIKNSNSGKLLEISAWSTEDGASAIQWTDNGGGNQHWQLVDAGGGRYKIKNKNSGKLLDVSESSSADAAQIIQWRDNGGNNQLWTIIAID